LLTLLLLFLAFSTAHALAKANVTSATLGNGLKVVVLEDRSIDLVAVDVWVRAGTINETEENNGVSHFIEHLLFKRTAKRGPGEVDKQIESLGATLDAITSRDWAHYRTVVARRYLPTAVEILADVMMRPEFDPHDIERERRVILDEIARRDSDQLQVALNSLYEAAFKEHPYRFTEEGTPDNVKKLSRQQILTTTIAITCLRTQPSS
jgi:zinc protease